MIDAYKRNIAFHTCTVQPHHRRGKGARCPVTDILRKMHRYYGTKYASLQPPAVNAIGILRICDMQLTSDAAVFLVTFSSALASDPAFQNQASGSVRIAGRNLGEAPAVAAHVWISTHPMQEKGFEHLMLVEKVVSLGTGRILKALNHLAEHGVPIQFPDDAGRIIVTWPEFSPHGIQSKTLGEMLDTGKLVGVDLVERDIGGVPGIDDKTATAKQRVTTFSINPNTRLEALAAFFGLAKNPNTEAKVRINYGGKYETEMLDTGRGNALETLFVKCETIQLNKGIPECATTMNPEIVAGMKRIADRFTQESGKDGHRS